MLQRHTDRVNETFAAKPLRTGPSGLPQFDANASPPARTRAHDVGRLAEALVDGLSRGGRRALQVGVDRFAGRLVRRRFSLRASDREAAFETLQRGDAVGRRQHAVEHLDDFAELVALRGAMFEHRGNRFLIAERGAVVKTDGGETMGGTTGGISGLATAAVSGRGLTESPYRFRRPTAAGHRCVENEISATLRRGPRRSRWPQ
jgi:hypothetical protein